MANRTSHAERVARQEVADRLESMAESLRQDTFEVRTGNKQVSLHPPGELNFEVSVRESSSLFRGNRESVTVTMDWKPDR